MSEPEEIDRLTIVAEDTVQIVTDLNCLLRRIGSKLRGNSTWQSEDHICLFRELIGMQKSIKTLCDDLINERMSDPSTTVNHVWHMIELYSDTPDTVKDGTELLERFFKLKRRSMIKPTNYEQTIEDYVRWQNDTVKYFVEQYHTKAINDRLNKIKRLWDWNYRAQERIFFGGAARPLHIKKVTEFSASMSVYYDLLWPLYKDNRDKLPLALNNLLHKERNKYWPNYEIFPCTASQNIIDKCLQYFYAKDRHNTWFVNSSYSDYIPFVNSAREIFETRFDGARMTSPDDHTTEWILKDLRQRCRNISRKNMNQIPATIVILLTSKNRFGCRIDVDHIHTELKREFPQIITLVDGCQDAMAFTQVDIIVYSKRFTTTGAIGLVSKDFLIKNPRLRKKLTPRANFPVGILAQIYISVNMMNEKLVYGVEQLVNSSRWNSWQSPLVHELTSAMSDLRRDRPNGLKYSYEEDTVGTILTLSCRDNGHVLLPKLWALLKKEGHSLDCFVMDNLYLASVNGISSQQIRRFIDHGFIDQIRQVEANSSDYLAWPLLPYWVTEPNDMTVADLHNHFGICRQYHCCLRMYMGRCGYSGKLSRLIELIDNIFATNKLDIPDDLVGKHPSQWPT
ncbi:unnamed protein product [Adineta ricciae]|uniref:Uncharacterized protein n=1 Tax=Adineta ricciae TaxID=249248 RepID=A0A816C2E7_ADIRI|nr:unnamed protein product [Adineta ricciae]